MEPIAEDESTFELLANGRSYTLTPPTASLLDYLLARTSVTFSDLVAHFRTSLSETEIRELLSELVLSGLIVCRPLCTNV